MKKNSQTAKPENLSDFLQVRASINDHQYSALMESNEGGNLITKEVDPDFFSTWPNDLITL